MPGVVLETLSFKKLMIFAAVVALFQIAYFLAGGLIAPAPSTSEQILTIKCIDRRPPKIGINSDKWFYSRPTNSCEMVDDIDDIKGNILASQVVFTAQFPLPRSGYQLDMTRWFQQIIGVLTLDIKVEKGLKVEDNAHVTLDVRLGYRNRFDPPDGWKEMARSMETRQLTCKLDEEVEGNVYDCDLIPLFTLGSCDYDYYLVNIRIPVDENKKLNTGIGALKDIWFAEIHQNGGFTKVWFALKTIVFPINLLAVIFFWRRVTMLARHPNLLERTIMAVGVVMTIVNCPVEWLSLKVRVSFWLILSDIRQGLFYSTILCFWIVFTGEHMMDDDSHSRNKITAYWKHLMVVGFGSAFLFLFDISERGVQLSNPFYSVWSHPVPAKMSMILIILAGIAACLYFLFLTFMIVQVLRGIWHKRRMLPGLPEARRRYYSGVIYRFCALLMYTLACCALTVVFFIVSQVNEDSWKWGDRALEYSSAFITGVYGMWNAYVFTLLCLYAPSHKRMSGEATGGADPLLSSAAEGGTRMTVTSGENEAIELRGPANSSGRAEGSTEEVVSVAATAASGDGLAFLMKTATD